jgi:ElaA protein
VTSYLRVLPVEGGGRRIGRVVTPPQHRGHGLAGQLLDAALEEAERPVLLDAQSHLVAMYERHGFAVDGDDFLDDGIPHTPMRLA